MLETGLGSFGCYDGFGEMVAFVVVLGMSAAGLSEDLEDCFFELACRFHGFSLEDYVLSQREMVIDKPDYS